METLGGLLPTLDPGWYWYCAVVVIGAAGGAVELIGRYKDAPFRVLLAPSAGFYVLVNAFVALMAYVMIVAFDWKFDIPDGAGHTELVRVLVAGFGAMVFFRSSLFSVRVGQTDVAVGPALLFQSCCSRPTGNATAIGPSRDRSWWPRSCAASISRRRTRSGPDADERGRQPGVARGGARARPAHPGSGAARAPDLGQLQAVDFNKAYPLLANVCFIMSTYGSEEEQNKEPAGSARQDQRGDQGHRAGQQLQNDAVRPAAAAICRRRRAGGRHCLRAGCHHAAERGREGCSGEGRGGKGRGAPAMAAA